MKKHALFLFIFIGVFFLSLAGYFLSKIKDEDKHFVFFVPEHEIVDITIDGMPVYYQDDNIYPQTMNTLYPVKVRVNHMEKMIRVDKIGKDKFIPIEIFSGGKSRMYKIQTLPRKFPKISFEKMHEVKEGYILTSFHGLLLVDPSYAMIFDTEGCLIWYRGNEDIEMSAFHLQQHKTDDKIRYSMHVQTDRSSLSYIRGKHLLMNEKFQVIDEVQVLKTDKHPAMPADEHEFVYIDDGHYIVLGYEEKTGRVDGYDKPVEYVSVIIQEQKDGKVVFEWVSDDYFELFGACQEKCIGSHNPDYMHINSVVIDPKDGHLVVSSASGYYLLKIHRKTGEILWRLGGKSDEFKLASEYLFYRQHDVQISEDRWVSVFDNQWSSQEGIVELLSENSRVLKLKINEDQKKIEEVKTYPLYTKAPFMGNVQTLQNGDMFVGCGSARGCTAKYIDNNGYDAFVLFVNKPYFSYRSYITDTLK